MPRKVANLRANARVMLALGEADDDFDVGLLEGVTEVVERAASDRHGRATPCRRTA